MGVISFETLHGYGGMHPGAALMSLAPRPAPYSVPAELRNPAGGREWGTLVSSTRTEGLHAEVAERAAAGPPASGSGTRGGESIWGSHSSEAQWLLEQKLGQKDAMETIGEDTRPWTPPDTARWTPPDGEMDQAF